MQISTPILAVQLYPVTVKWTDFHETLCTKQLTTGNACSLQLLHCGRSPWSLTNNWLLFRSRAKFNQHGKETHLFQGLCTNEADNTRRGMLFWPDWAPLVSPAAFAVANPRRKHCWLCASYWAII